MTAAPGQIALRRFDHDEALRRYAAGETIGDLARGYGVVRAAVARVVDPKTRRRMDIQSARNIEKRRVPCRGGCRRLVYTKRTKPRSGYCPACLGERRNVVRHGTETEYRQGCRCGDCLAAASAAKRARRERSRVPCSHGCGTLVDSINRRDPDKPLECRSCAARRVQREKRAA